jgi:shikimate kinase
MTITLIGMPGSGKSMMGIELAKALGYRWIDGDKAIEEKTGRALQSIINEDGLASFRKIEEEVLLSLAEENTVVSTGGSAIYYPAAMENFKANGKVVYLYVGVDEIIRRLGDYSKRGIVLAPGKTIRDLFEERSPLYEKYADITLNCDGRDYATYQKTLNEKMAAICTCAG